MPTELSGIPPKPAGMMPTRRCATLRSPLAPWGAYTVDGMNQETTWSGDESLPEET